MALVDRDLLFEILEFIDAIGLMRCTAVCRAWHRAIEHQRGSRLKAITKEWGVYVLGGHGYSGLATMIRYRPGDAGWTYVPPMPQARCHFATVVCNRKIYVFGGRFEDERLASSICYDPTTQQWTDLPPMKSVRSAAVAAAHGSSIYVFGGFDGTHEVNTVERFDTATRRWAADAAPMPTALSDAAIVTLDHAMYIIGGARNCGKSDEEVLNTCFKFSPRLNTWTQMACMGVSRMFPAAAAANGLIYITAGVTPNEDGWKQANIRLMFVNSTEVFDPKANSWAEGPPLSTQRQNPTATTCLGNIYVVGGHCGDPLDAVERLPIAQAGSPGWLPSLPMPDKRDACRAITLL